MESNQQFAPPRSFVADRAANAAEIVKADRGARLGAVIIDGMIYGAAIMPAVFLAAFTLGRQQLGHAGSVPTAQLFAAILATGLWFYIGGLVLVTVWIINLVLLHRNGQTLGKKALGIKIVRPDGSRGGLLRIYFLRSFVNGLFVYIPGIGNVYGLADALVIFGNEKRCIHDYLADTIVVQA